MKILVDADACPNDIKAILYRAADRTQTNVVLVANQTLAVPKSKYVQFKKVSSGFDVADSMIVALAEPRDLIITADIPLAAEVIEKGASALHPRGEQYSTETIKQKLAMRDFMDTMRSSGIHTGGPAKFTERDKQKFANQLDKYLRQNAA
ncbi:MAG: YaiI/YqxD family protein [Gammaproteobacteria bacterium]